MASVLIFSLAACGGGDGGGGGTSGAGVQNGGTATPGNVVDTRVRIALYEKDIKIIGDVGQASPSVQMAGSVVGTVPADAYAGGEDLGSAIDHVDVGMANGTLSLKVVAKSGLQAGTYQGKLKLLACPDRACAAHFEGSPLTLPYTVTITTGFGVSTESIDLRAASGAGVRPTADVAVLLGAVDTSYRLSWYDNIVKVSNNTQAGFTLTAVDLPPGNYEGVVRVVSNTGKTRNVSVHYTVTRDASTVTRIIPSVDSLRFTAMPGAYPSSQVLELTLPSWAASSSASIIYQDKSDWLTMARIDDRHYRVGVTSANLAPGAYDAYISLSAEPQVSAVIVPVRLGVGTVTWNVSGERNFVIGPDTTASQLEADVTLDIPNLVSQPWRATSDAPWLTLDTAAGMTGWTHLKAHVNVAEIAKWANTDRFSGSGTGFAQVTVTSTNPLVPPMRLGFRIDMAIPQMRYVSPSTRLPGEAGTYALRGVGFNSVADVRTALKVNGATPVSVTRITDTELAVRLPGGSGDVTFSLLNALGLNGGSAALKVAAPVVYPYRALPAVGAKRGLVYDARRQTLYTANVSDGTVMQFAFDGIGWRTSSAPLPGINNVALSPDGAELIATSSTSNTLVLLDPVTLATLETYEVDSIISAGPKGSFGEMAVTNDGHAYFAGIGALRSMGMHYFDLVSRRFSYLPTGTRDDGIAWLDVSGDGSHLLSGSWDASGNPKPIWYWNSTDVAYQPNGADIKASNRVAQSLHGERLVVDAAKVFDRNFGAVGNLTVPAGAGYAARTAVLSPDGGRAYVLAYDLGHDPSTPMRNPRVYVFDTGTALVPATDLPLLGYFDVADLPGCVETAASPGTCNETLFVTISPDGNTLFFMGDQKLVVAPVRALLPATSGAQPRGAVMQRIARPN